MEATQTWTLAGAGFSDNYAQWLTGINVLRQVAQFKDVDSKDYILVFPFIYGVGADDPNAVLEIGPGKSVFVEHASEVFATLATEFFQKLEDDGELDEYS